MPVLSYLNTCDFDFGALARLGDHMKRLGIERPMICTDNGIKAAGILDTVEAALPGGKSNAIYTDTPPNPTEDAVLEAVKIYKDAGCDGVLALGGGSSMDLAKGVALLATHEAPLAQYGAGERGSGKIGELAPLIAIPTTSGTGSEVSVGAVVILNNGRKDTFASPHLIPKVAICDPELTLGLPAHITAATGMDAVTHCIEAVLSLVVNPPAEGIGYDGLERAIGMGHLEAVVKDGSDRDARWNMMMASTEGAFAFVKGLGSVHAMSHAAGRIKELKLHHGTLNAVILPTILRYNEEVCADKYERLRRAMRVAPTANLADEIEALNGRLGLPANLKEMGVTEDMMDGLVQYSLSDLANFTNPKPVDAAGYEMLFKQAMGVA